MGPASALIHLQMILPDRYGDDDRYRHTGNG